MVHGLAQLKRQPRHLAAGEQASLVARVAQGDTSAENELVQLFQRRILAMMLSRVGEAETARDLTQDTLMAVVVALREGKIREAERLAAFIYGIARNVVSGYYRGRHPDTVPLEPEHAASNAGDLLENLQRREIVSRLLSSLGPEDRRILDLSLVEGLRSGEIAEHLGLSPEAVRARKSRAIKRAAESLRRLRGCSSALEAGEARP